MSFGAILSVLCPPAWAETSNAETYITVCMRLGTAERCDQDGDPVKALEIYQDCQTSLLRFRQKNPDWYNNTVLELLHKVDEAIIVVQTHKILQAALLAKPAQATISDGSTFPRQMSLKLMASDSLQKNGDYAGALAAYREASYGLMLLHKNYPEWEKDLILQRMAVCQAKIVELQNADRQPKISSATSSPISP